jgi:hypothetical protein
VSLLFVINGLIIIVWFGTKGAKWRCVVSARYPLDDKIKRQSGNKVNDYKLMYRRSVANRKLIAAPAALVLAGGPRVTPVRACHDAAITGALPKVLKTCDNFFHRRPYARPTCL